MEWRECSKLNDTSLHLVAANTLGRMVQVVKHKYEVVITVRFAYSPCLGTYIVALGSTARSERGKNPSRG